MKMKMWPTFTVVTFLFMLVNPCTNLRFRFSHETSINEDIEEAKTKFKEAYNATVEAEGAGVKVGEAVEKLNNALDYIFQAENHTAHGDIEQAFLWTQAAIQLSEETLVLTQELRQQAETLRYTRLVFYSIIFVVLLILVVYAFFIGRRMWKRRRQNRFMEMSVKGTLGST